MASDIGTHVNAGFICKWITVGKMKELLDGLDDELELHPNCVGNLTIVDPVDKNDQGYVDVAKEAVAKWSSW